MTTTAPQTTDQPRGLAAIRQLPAWASWSIYAAIGVAVLATVQVVSGTELLTSEGTSNAMIRWSIPILLAGLGGLFSERSGTVNIGLEGMMIFGTWFAAWGAMNWGPWGGLIAGTAGGALGGLMLGIAVVTFNVDHIIAAVAINILAPGLTRFLSERVFTERGGSVSQSPRVDRFERFDIPVISDGLGWIRDQGIFWISDIAGMVKGLVSNISIFVVIALALVPLTAWVVNKTRFGLRLRICGENPTAGESLGVNIYRHKYMGVIISGALAGLAGAFIVIELSQLYRGGQTLGRGYIGLAALIFGNWRARGVLLGALVFSYPFALSLVDFTATTSGEATRALLLVIAIGLAAVAVWAFRNHDRLDTGLAIALCLVALAWYLGTTTAQSWLPNTMPYALVLIVLFFASQHLRPPKAAGQPWQRGDH